MKIEKVKIRYVVELTYPQFESLQRAVFKKLEGYETTSIDLYTVMACNVQKMRYLLYLTKKQYKRFMKEWVMQIE